MLCSDSRHCSYQCHRVCHSHVVLSCGGYSRFRPSLASRPKSLSMDELIVVMCFYLHVGGVVHFTAFECGVNWARGMTGARFGSRRVARSRPYERMLRYCFGWASTLDVCHVRQPIACATGNSPLSTHEYRLGCVRLRCSCFEFDLCCGWRVHT